jgi:small multidrug resistance pump
VNNPVCQEQKSERGAASPTTWWLLGLAVCFEIAGAIGLRFSEGFSVLLPTGLALGAFAVALYLVSKVMRKLPVSIAYPVWAGGGTAGVALLGVFALGEEVDAAKIIGVALVIIGVVIINRVSEKTSGC